MNRFTRWGVTRVALAIAATAGATPRVLASATTDGTERFTRSWTATSFDVTPDTFGSGDRPNLKDAR